MPESVSRFVDRDGFDTTVTRMTLALQTRSPHERRGAREKVKQKPGFQLRAAPPSNHTYR